MKITVDHLQGNRAQVKVPVLAGMAIRGQVRRMVETICALHDLELDTRELKGFLESTYIFTFEGKADDAMNAKDDIMQYFDDVVANRV